MIAVLAHVRGLPIEEAVPFAAPAAAVWLSAVIGRLRERRRRLAAPPTSPSRRAPNLVGAEGWRITAARRRPEPGR